MKLPKAHSPTADASSTVLATSRLLAGAIIAVVLVQLMAYEKFVPLVLGSPLLTSLAAAKIFAALVVAGEVMTLPFLLRLSLSPLFRWFSAGCLVFACLAWFVIGAAIGAILIVQLFPAALASVVLWGLRKDFEA